jgi:hypothetical protein
MTSRRQSFQASGTYAEGPRAGGGGGGDSILANNVYVPVTLTPPPPALTGSITTPFLFTPSLTGVGKILIMYATSGSADAVGRLLVFETKVAAVTELTLETSPGGDPGFTAQSAGQVIVSGLTPGVPVLIEVDWTASGGLWSPDAGEGGITVIELP